MAWPVGLVCFGVAGVVALCIVSYVVYKTKASKHKHNQNGNSSSSRTIQELVTIEDIKPASVENTGGTEVRHRNVSTESNVIDHQEIQTASKSIDHQETQTTSNSFNTQGSQTDLFEPQPYNILSNLSPNHDSRFMDPNLNIDRSEARSVTSNGETESVFSGSSLDTVSSSSSICNIPSWDDMSDAERGACICTACKANIVTTITYPCRHPYFCSSCAPVLFRFYHRCVKCKKRIKSYDNVF